MNYLYAPWREQYINDKTPDSPVCPFCLKESREHDAQKFILKRYQHAYVMLNAYPYNAGHAMVIPFKHCSGLHELSPEELHEFIKITAQTTKILQEKLTAAGMNIGMNMGGYAAGGTIPEHIHMHVLPRFKGDTNFLPLLAATKQISHDLNALYQELVDVFNALT